MKEYNLSDKAYWCVSCSCGIADECKSLSVKDVKEFIKRLKGEIIKREKITMEEIIGRGLTARERDKLHNEIVGKLSDFINDLAGDKLK